MENDHKIKSENPLNLFFVSARDLQEEERDVSSYAHFIDYKSFSKVTYHQLQLEKEESK